MKHKSKRDGSVISLSIDDYATKMIQFALMRAESKKREHKQNEEYKEREHKY